MRYFVEITTQNSYVKQEFRSKLSADLFATGMNINCLYLPPNVERPLIRVIEEESNARVVEKVHGHV